MLCSHAVVFCACVLQEALKEALKVEALKEDVRRALLQHALNHPEEQSQVGQALQRLDACTLGPDEQTTLARSLQMPRLLLSYLTPGVCMPEHGTCT